MSPAFFRVAITTGDTDGIGTEVAAKALVQLRPQKDTRFYLWRSPSTPDTFLKLIDREFTRETVTSLDEALSVRNLNPNQLVDINSDQPPARWVEQSAHACLAKSLNALVTGPLSKTAIRDAGIQQIGHTGILQEVSGCPRLFMGFLGQHFSVLPMTGHIPLKEVPLKLTPELMQDAILIADNFIKKTEGVNHRPLGLVGINPHAGENGMIGNEEKHAYLAALNFAHEKGIAVEGPLVPDAAFFPSQWRKYSLYLCPYHDQALIPFKMIHTQDSGAHITLGLPFVRTSVDHGTAKDIFNRDKANPNSMVDALKWALRLIQARTS